MFVRSNSLFAVVAAMKVLGFLQCIRGDGPGNRVSLSRMFPILQFCHFHLRFRVSVLNSSHRKCRDDRTEFGTKLSKSEISAQSTFPQLFARSNEVW